MVTHTYIHTYTHDNYYNPRCAHAHRGLIIGVLKELLNYYYNESTEVQTLGVIRIQL